MHLATSSCNPACQERRSITAFLHGAVPRRFVTAGFKLAYAKSTNVPSVLTLELRPHKSGAAPTQVLVIFM